MRKAFLVALISASFVLGQTTVTRNVRMVNIANPAGLAEAATTLRTVCDMPAISVDTASSSIVITDTPQAVALAEWVLAAVDNASALSPQQYRPNGAADDVVKVVYLANTNTGQGVQEILTQLRTVVSLSKVFNVTQPRALVFRGNGAMVTASEWLIAQLDKPFDPQASPVSYQFVGAPSGGDQMQVFYLHNIATPKPTQELLTAIRMQAQVQHVFVSTSPRAIAMRGTSDQIAATANLVAERDIISNRN